MFYKVIIETGHRRGDNHFQIVRYLKADNSVHLFDMLEGEPGMNAGEFGYAITMVKSISSEEYEQGRVEEKKNPVHLRANVRFKINKKCLIKFEDSDTARITSLEGQTHDISAGGVGISYKGPQIPVATILEITIDQLQVTDKKAEIVWIFLRDGTYKSGLKWL